MADAANPLSGKVELDTTDYKTGVAELSRQVKIIESGFKAAAAGMDDWSKSSVGVEARQKALNSIIDIQRQKINLLTAAYADVVAKKGADSKAAEDLLIRINRETEALNKNQLELDHVASGTTKMVTEQKSALSATDSLKLSISAFNSALQIAQQMISAVGKAYNETIGKEMAYALEMGKTSRVIGTTIEETSRLIQMGDDLGVEQGTLTNILEFASKNGLQPTIENLANTSDELLAMTDITQRNEAAAKQFGKGWTDASQVILAGGAAIRELAAAQDEGMIATQKMFDDAEAARKSLDSLNDTVTALNNTLSAKFVPGLTDTLQSTQRFIDAFEQSGGSLLKFVQYLAQTREGFHYYTDAVDQHTAALQAQGEAAQKAKQYQIDYGTAVEATARENDHLAQVVEMNTNRALDDQAAADKRAADAANELKTAQEGVNSAMSQLSGAQAQLQTATQNLYNQLGGMAVASADKAHASAKRTLEAYRIQDEAFGTHTALTVEKTDEVDKATQEFMNSPQAESDKQAYLKRLDDIKAKYAETDTSIETSKTKIKELQDQIDKLTSKTIEIIIKTYHEDIQGAPGGGSTIRDKPGNPGGPTGAAGLDFIVPPFYPNDSLPVWVQSGERVTVLPANQVSLSSSKGPGKTGAAITQTFYTSDPISTHMVLEQARRDKLAAIEGRL